MKISAEKTGLFWGTILLLGSNIIVKGLGFFYRVILVRLLGVEGVGLIEMAAPIYSFLLVLAGCGIQTSLSQIIAAKHGEEGKTYLKTALVMLLISGIFITGLAYLLAPWLIANFAPDNRIILCFKMLLPAIIIICIASAFRGLFQGNKQVSTLGMSQNIEQIIRVIIGIWLISELATASIETQTSAASIATVCGELAGFLYLLFLYFRSQAKLFPNPHSKGKFSLRAAKELLGLGLPLTGSRLVTSGIMMLQAILIPLCLKMSGWDIRAATEIYGRFSGVALALLHLPGVFTAALSVSVLPAVAESMTYDISGRRLLSKRVNDSMQASSSFTLLGMLLLFIFAEPLCTLIFDNRPAASLLQLLTIGGMFMYLQTTLTSVLQGLGEVKTLFINNIISGVILIIGIVLLTPLPSLGINGTVIAVNLCWISGFVLNLFSFYRKTQVKLDWKNIAFRPLVAAAITTLAYYSQKFFSPQLLVDQSISTLLLEALAVSAVYLINLYLQGGLIKIRRGQK